MSTADDEDLDYTNPYHRTDLWRMVRGLDLLDRIQRDLYPDPQTLEWFLPEDILPGVTRAWGIQVRRVPGLPAPYLAHRIQTEET